LKAISLQGRCIVYLFKSLFVYTLHVLVSHN